VNEFTIKTGLIARMIDELEFDEIYRNEFIRKLAMIDNTHRIIQYKMSLEASNRERQRIKSRSRK